MIRLAITYGCGIWAAREKGEGLQASTLRRISGPYKRTAVART